MGNGVLGAGGLAVKNICDGREVISIILQHFTRTIRRGGNGVMPLGTGHDFHTQVKGILNHYLRSNFIMFNQLRA